MKSKPILTIITMFFLAGALEMHAQEKNSSVKERKFEVAPEFTTITFDQGETRLGLGGRLTYNLNSYFALEAAAYFFPEDCDFCGRNSGRTSEGLFGVKIGKRFSKWGIFGKVRPGLISSGKGNLDFILPGTPANSFSPPFDFVQKRQTSFITDLGGVLEFYPTKRIITRFDFGLPIIHYGGRTINVPVFDPVTGVFTLRPSAIPSQTRGSLQIMTSVGFRF